MQMHGSSGSGLTALLAAQHRPINAGAKLFASHLAASGPLDGWAVLGRDLTRVEPVVDVPGLDGPTDCESQRTLRFQHLDGLLESFFGGHVNASVSKLPCIMDANKIARNTGKMICVENLGELVKKWREDSGLNASELAHCVRSHALTTAGLKCQRQHIEQLEAAGNRVPRYLPDLARAMHTTVDDLLALRMPKPFGPKAASAPAAPPADFRDRREVSDSDWATLEAVKMLLPQEKIEELVRQAKQAKSHVLERLKQVSPSPQPHHQTFTHASEDGAPLYGKLVENDVVSTPSANKRLKK